MVRPLVRPDDPPKAPKRRLSRFCYLVCLGTGMAVTLVTFVLMMVTMRLPYWYRSKQQHPRIDIGLFRNCSTEGLNRTCHELNHDFEVVGSYLFGISSSILMLGTFVLLIALLFSGGRIKRLVIFLFTIFGGPFWLFCVLIYYTDYDNIFEGYQHGVCWDIATITIGLCCLAIIPACAIFFYAGFNVPCYFQLVPTIRDVQYAPPAEGTGGPEGAGGAGGDIEDRANMDNVDPDIPGIQDAGEGGSQNIPDQERLNIQDPGSQQQRHVHIRTWVICCISWRLSLVINEILD